jgi:hypothetical protein
MDATRVNLLGREPLMPLALKIEVLRVPLADFTIQ